MLADNFSFVNTLLPFVSVLPSFVRRAVCVYDETSAACIVLVKPAVNRIVSTKASAHTI